MILLGESWAQLCVFGLFWAVGAIVGACYTLGCLLTRNRTAAIVFDLLFGLAAAAAVFWANLRFNNGEARLFVFVALGSGGTIAYLICHKPLDKLAQVVYNRLTSANRRQDNDPTVPQKVNIDTDRRGDIAGGGTVMHTADHPVAKGVARRPHKQAAHTRRSRKNQ